MSRDIRTVIDGLTFTECPRWHDGRLWFVDFYTARVLSVTEDGGDLRTEAEVEQQPSGLGWLPDGRLLVVSQRDQRILRREADGTLATHADLSHVVSSQLNDMVVDTTGRAWVGNFGFDLMGGAAIATTALHRVDPDGSVHLAASDLWFPNGSVVTGGGKTLLVDETLGNRVSAFDIADDGGLGRRRTWASFGPVPTETAQEKALAELSVAPDGCTLDAEGCLWIADALGGRALRVREGGEIVDEVSPGTGVFACGLGGSDGRTLYLCAAPDFLEHNRRAAREGALLATTVEVPAA
ncbi:SMP-30/gluconolactonase/LRE family protein [Actinomycetospora endophytica]|uniref:SMP-30/gluconolactonase/LRE family protein n=1 Tax=Actinomycetospora endophytica TaxID=2291215 RepID=A0ABS8PAZ8_9PSEU|nr:SMP-30/gluconolactonase/LRE family protein [Actinomycetospora endophytica]MCD2195443.1 SMP-30/gluconolactonase/LRE family protein [Actinomycetospora endophytica]